MQFSTITMRLTLELLGCFILAISATSATGTAGLSTKTTATPSNHGHKPRECACTPENIWLDFIILLDTSNSMTQHGLELAKRFLNGVIGGLTVSQQLESGASRVAIVRFANIAVEHASLISYQNATSAMDGINAIPFSGHHDLDLRGALQKAADVIKESDNRPNAQNLILLVTSANTIGDFQDPHPIADQLKNEQNTIITVGFGQDDEADLPDIDFGSPGFNFNNTDPDFNQKLLNALCKTNCFCPPRWTQYTTENGTRKFGECIYPGDLATTWDQAQQACQKIYKNGYLANELSQDKHSFLQDFANENLKQQKYWIGLNDKERSGYYEWANSVGQQPVPLFNHFDYTNWAPSMPNDLHGQRSCIVNEPVVGFYTQWKNKQCSSAFTESHVYFCQIDACDTDTYCY